MKNNEILKKALLSILMFEPARLYNSKQLASMLKSTGDIRLQDVADALDVLHKEGLIKKDSQWKYYYEPAVETIIARLHFTPGGRVFVMNEELNIDLPVSSSKTNRIIHNDLAEVRLVYNKSGRQKAEILKVTTPYKGPIIGVLYKEKGRWMIDPDDKRMLMQFEVKGDLLGATEKYIVQGEVIGWPRESKEPQVKITAVYGLKGENQAEMHAIVAEFGFSPTFKPETEKECENIPNEIDKASIKNREDFREWPVVTIDPEDAKDFDDALSILPLKNNRWQIGVHIADVSHYVVPGTAIDTEAADRGTSVYLVDRTIPMLPEKLSNNLCSLKPHVDRLSFSAVFELDDHAKVLDVRFCKSVIHSKHRFSYEKAQEVLETKEGPFATELLKLNELALLLNKKRFEEGSLSFESPETKFELDPDGKPIGVYSKVRKEAHKLIEEFMLLANKYVAWHIFKQNEKDKKHPFVYRFHDVPTFEKLLELKTLAKKFGYRLDIDGPELAVKNNINQLTAQAKGKPEETLIQQLSVRTMAKAVYTPNYASHYGLGFNCYTHFTSPIRRYPDLLVHRMLQEYLTNDKALYTLSELDYFTRHCTQKEQKAVDAERASTKYKMAEYMKMSIGKTFAGTISGVTDWGIYVELTDNRCEGLVRVNQLKDDRYEFNEKQRSLVGRKYKKSYNLGDKVDIIVMGANPEKRTIDFGMVD